ncbi:MAG: hypothetical protein AB7G11_10980 [Phycisphaerales bacterium]
MKTFLTTTMVDGKLHAGPRVQIGDEYPRDGVSPWNLARALAEESGSKIVGLLIEEIPHDGPEPRFSPAQLVTGLLALAILALPVRAQQTPPTDYISGVLKPRLLDADVVHVLRHGDGRVEVVLNGYDARGRATTSRAVDAAELGARCGFASDGATASLRYRGRVVRLERVEGAMLRSRREEAEIGVRVVEGYRGVLRR